MSLNSFFKLQKVKVFLISLVVALLVIINFIMLSKVTANSSHQLKHYDKHILK